MRSDPKYCVAKALVLEGLGNTDMKHTEAAADAFQQCLNMPSLSQGSSPQAASLRASVYESLIRCYTKLGRLPEAAKAVQDGLREFRGTPEEVRTSHRQL